ncbi:MAG: glycerate kinase [Candidatus Aminicenantales bacterium]
MDIFWAGLRAVDPRSAIPHHVKRQGDRLIVGDRTYSLSRFDRIYALGAGKASAAMAQAVEGLLGDRLTSGLVITKVGHSLPLERVKVLEAGHPIPDEAGLEGARQLVEILKQTTEKDLVLFLVSGGGSALLPFPAEGLTLEEKQTVTEIFLEVGAPIQDINTVRKHLSLVKGGRLARLAHPATLIALILSDVIGDDLDTIASGPTVPDETTYADSLKVLERYGIRKKIPQRALAILEEGSRGEREETPKRGALCFQKTQNLVVASNIHAVRAAAARARDLGYNALILSTCIEGETREVARVHAAVAKEIARTGNPIPAPACVISGGETTVTVCGTGRGGRNQEFALAAAIEIAGMPNVWIMSAGTDGTDGPTEAAGAVADGRTVERAAKKGMEPRAYLKDNDSYHFFKALGNQVITGPTQTNVMDLCFVVVV